MEENESTTHVIFVNNEDEIGANGEGIYINTGAERKCPYCGQWVDKDNIWHGYNGECLDRSSGGGHNDSYSNNGGNQYGEGYEQGQEDASRGLAPNPSGYGGNGQFEKGYEDGYNNY